MKTYKSRRNMEFKHVLSCALDNQTNQTKFIQLWRFIADFEHDALWEWLKKRNFTKNLKYVVETLKDIEILT